MISRLALLTIFLTVGMQLVNAQGEPDGSLLHEGRARTFHTFIPESYTADGDPVALIVALHPEVSSGRAMQALSGLDEAAATLGAIVVYPDNGGPSWDDGRIAADWPTHMEATGDGGFIDKLLDQMLADYRIDPARVYLAGFADGGQMTYSLSCTLPERFSRVAIIGALMWDYAEAQCPQEATPQSMLIVLGGQDNTNPLEGRALTPGPNSREFAQFGVVETGEFWSARNGCDAAVPVEGDGVTFVSYVDCSEGAELNLVIIQNARKNWFRSGDAYRLNQLGPDTATMVARFFAGDPSWVEAAQTNAEEIIARTYWAYVPTTYDPAEPMPMVFALHGRPDNGRGIAYRMDMNGVAEENGFIIVYPDGLNLGWNSAAGSAFFEDSGVDDIGFLTALVDDLAVDLNIERGRVFVTGFSNGGLMTNRLLCDATATFAAFAIVGATATGESLQRCIGVEPSPLLYIQGSADVSFPWNGIPATLPNGQPIMVQMAVPDTIAAWAAHHNCILGNALQTLPESGLSPGTQVHIMPFGCPATTPFQVYIIEGGGHNIPGVPGRISAQIAGQVNMDIHAGEVIWEFFSRQQPLALPGISEP